MQKLEMLGMHTGIAVRVFAFFPEEGTKGETLLLRYSGP